MKESDRLTLRSLKNGSGPLSKNSEDIKTELSFVSHVFKATLSKDSTLDTIISSTIKKKVTTKSTTQSTKLTKVSIKLKKEVIDKIYTYKPLAKGRGLGTNITKIVDDNAKLLSVVKNQLEPMRGLIDKLNKLLDSYLSNEYNEGALVLIKKTSDKILTFRNLLQIPRDILEEILSSEELSVLDLAVRYAASDKVVQ